MIMTPEDDNNKQEEKTDAPKRKPKRGPVYYRRARRKARQLGLVADNDEHAAQLLEERGINVMKDDVSLIDAGKDGEVLMTPEGGSGVSETASGITLNDAERLAQVHAIQRDLVKRRRRRFGLLFLRLFFFVVLPTYFVGNYYYNEATPMYETKAEFVIQKSESGGGMGLSSLLSGTGFANSADSIVVQGYLTSREAMLRLNREHGFLAHFQQDVIDDLQRLDPNASLEDAYDLYSKYVVVGYDPSEGVIRLEVVAANPETSAQFANALIGYAEERVDKLSQRVREDQMKGTRETYEDAEKAMVAAQDRVLELQQLRGVFSADEEISLQMAIINSLELQLEQKIGSLGEMLENPSPNPIRVEALERDIERLRERVAELRLELTDTSTQGTSLATISGELSIAETNLQTRQLMLQQALQQLESARVEANRQVRYLSIGVSPVAPDVASYPRKFENTALAFIIFFGIYIMLSLTVSILREQVSV